MTRACSLFGLLIYFWTNKETTAVSRLCNVSAISLSGWPGRAHGRQRPRLAGAQIMASLCIEHARRPNHLTCGTSQLTHVWPAQFADGKKLPSKLIHCCADCGERARNWVKLLTCSQPKGMFRYPIYIILYRNQMSRRQTYTSDLEIPRTLHYYLNN